MKIFRNCHSIGSHTFIHSDVKIESLVKAIGAFGSLSRGMKISLGVHPKKQISTSLLFYDSYMGRKKNTNYDDVNVFEDTVIGNDVLISANIYIW